jgi:flap endonuclease-1
LGVDLKDLIPRKKISLSELSGKTVAVDAYNVIYQFLAIIRGPTGEHLQDSRGHVTSHLSGILYRNSNFLEKGIKVIYVFDGKPPTLKEAEIQRRKKFKEEATVMYEAALRKGDFEEAKKFAQATSKLKDYMVEDSTKLLELMGIPWVQAPSEGEAQAAYMTARGDAWACASQDYDTLLFGAPRLVRNMAITGRRKLPGKGVYVEVEPELVELSQVLASVGVDRRELVDIGILIGTDFNPDGIKGIGPKTALKLIREHKTLEKALEGLEDVAFDVDPKKIEAIFLEPEVTKEYSLEWKDPDVEGVVRFLCKEHDFNEIRVRDSLQKATQGIKEETKKTTLEKWFG